VLHKEIPFLRIVVPLCSGIITGLLSKPVPIIIAILLILVTVGLSLSFFYNSRLRNYLFGISASMAFFTSGLILITREKSSISVLESEQTNFLATLTDYPVEKVKTYLVTIKLDRLVADGNIKPVKGSMLLYHRKDSLMKKLKPGDMLSLKCTPIEISNRGNPYEFDYKSFMACKGIRYYAFTGTGNITGNIAPEHRKLKYRALIIRERIIKMYEERGIRDERLALVSAITLGQKNLLDPEQKQIFINAGVMHIMAVSGLHAVILSLFIFNMLFFLKGRFNIFRVIITIVFLWAFAFITGLSPSVLRATLMFSFLQAGNLMKRKVNGINSVLASAFVLIILKPSVITEAGFLLSYSAVIFIIGFYQDLYLKFSFKKWLPDKIWQSVVVTLVAQAGTLPLTIMLFNRFPVYFILTNIIIVPLSSLLIILGCLVPLTYSIAPVSRFLASILDSLTGLTEFLTGTAASLPGSTIDNIGLTPAGCILLTLAMVLSIGFLLKNRPFSIKYPVAAFILLAIAGNIRKAGNGKTNQLIVYNNPVTPVIGIQTGNILHVRAKNDSVPVEVQRHAATRGLKVKTIESGERPVLYRVGTNTIMITDSLRGIWLKDNELDIVVLTGSKPFVEKDLPVGYFPETIIVSSETVSGFRLPLPPEEIRKRTIRYVRKSGAYVCRL
jgi:competence protein ComEC